MDNQPPPVPPPPPPPVNPAASPPQQLGYGQPPVQQRSWFSRNWGWVLGCGCLSVLLGGALVVLLIVMFIFSAIKNTDIYKVSLQQVQNSPAAQAQLGTPIEGGFLVSGNVNITNNSGNANLSIPVSGPNGSGTAKVRATLVGGKWKINSLVLDVTGQPAPVVIVPAGGPTVTPEQGSSGAFYTPVAVTGAP